MNNGINENPLFGSELDRVLSRINSSGFVAWRGPYQDLLSDVQSSIAETADPLVTNRLRLIERSLAAARHDMILLFVLVLRLSWLKSSEQNPLSNQQFLAMARAFLEVDINAFHRLVISVGNNISCVIFETIDGQPGPATFNNLFDQVNGGAWSIPFGLPGQIGEAVVGIAPIVRGAQTISGVIETMGGKEVVNLTTSGDCTFQVFDWDNRSVLSSLQENLGLPSKIVGVDEIDLHVYFGAVLGRLLAFMDEMATGINDVFQRSGFLNNFVTMERTDPNLPTFLRQRGFSTEEVSLVLQAATSEPVRIRTRVTAESIAIGTFEAYRAIIAARDCVV
ncbi:MAG: hypothetical protein QG574_1456 [Cyanobacteriota bacterium erpe_2018_sw_21hr_WHONDRS-SW48-000092_B_bin.40]|jgi:hypothetical protein|nr:hypothetical protein [Cyanobacteriota bacterium erpe_2018_sw_21hr_WHONDRS-SW48-000092_B_bin.40]